MANNILGVDPSILMGVLMQVGLLGEDEQFEDISIAGAGNMNLVVRFETTSRSLILKQSQPFVNKYPHIPAPQERIFVEHYYYQTIQSDHTLLQSSPLIIGFLPNWHLLVMNDLGPSADFTSIYQGNKGPTEYELEFLVAYLLRLHQLKVKKYPDNAGMKKLNHEHIFVFPFLEENGFDLNLVQDGLQDLAMRFKTDGKLKYAIDQVGERYLSSGRSLLHGDFYPGSWLRTSDGIKVIDPEFSFLGDPEFDLGVAIAHLMMAKASPQAIFQLKALYVAENKLDLDLLDQYTGVEILRRLIGLAQLPLPLTLPEKQELADYSRNLILHK